MIDVMPSCNGEGIHWTLSLDVEALNVNLGQLNHDEPLSDCMDQNTNLVSSETPSSSSSKGKCLRETLTEMSPSGLSMYIFFNNARTSSYVCLPALLESETLEDERTTGLFGS